MLLKPMTQLTEKGFSPSWRLRIGTVVTQCPAGCLGGQPAGPQERRMLQKPPEHRTQSEAGNIILPTLFNIIIDCILRYKQRKSEEASGSSDSIVPAVRFYAHDRCIAGTDAVKIQQSLDTIVDGFSQMGIQVNPCKTKWMYVAGTMRVNRIQHGVYCNLIQGGPDSYMDKV